MAQGCSKVPGGVSSGRGLPGSPTTPVVWCWCRAPLLLVLQLPHCSSSAAAAAAAWPLLLRLLVLTLLLGLLGPLAAARAAALTRSFRKFSAAFLCVFGAFAADFLTFSGAFVCSGILHCSAGPRVCNLFGGPERGKRAQATGIEEHRPWSLHSLRLVRILLTIGSAEGGKLPQRPFPGRILQPGFWTRPVLHSGCSCGWPFGGSPLEVPSLLAWTALA